MPAKKKRSERAASKKKVVRKKKEIKKAVNGKADVLNPQQELFAYEYIVDLNGKQAAIRAGYSEKTAEQQASRLLSLVKVQRLVCKLKKERIDEVKIDASYVLKQAVKVHERCMQEEQLVDKDGCPTGEFKFEHAGANKALEIIGKHVDVQAFKDVVVVDPSDAMKEVLEMINGTSLGPPSLRDKQ